MTKQLTLQEYEKLLKQHDWYYMMSEDSMVYKRGCHTRDVIEELSNLDPTFKDMYNIYKDKHKIN